MDKISPEKRSEIMSKIRGKDTSPEMKVRRLVYAMGYRYKLHRKDLPGKPDLVFKGRGKVIFVHGCFWHGHKECRKSALPKTNTEFWYNKISGNIRRDGNNIEKLKELGYEVLIVWECETGDPESLTKKITKFLKEDRESSEYR